MNLVANQNATAGEPSQITGGGTRRPPQARINPRAGQTFGDLLGAGQDASTGLLGVLKNLNIVHNLEGDQGAIEIQGGAVLPKNIEINFDFAAIHEHHLGWDAEGNFSNDAFPYGINAAGASTKEQLDAAANSAATRYNAETTTQQNIANAQARYAGAMGGMRYRRDKRKVSQGFDQAATAEGLSAEERTDLDYLVSSTRGQEFLGED